MSETGPSSKALSDAVREAVTLVLHELRLYEPDSYGWLNAEDVDPEYVGHAMNQTDSLAFRVLDAHIEALQSRGVKVPVLEEWQKYLIRSGGDFEGLMKAARWAIGLAIFNERAAPSTQFEVNEMFHLHLISAMMTLGAASDRIRDLFIAANFRTTRKKYENGSWLEKARSDYATPFAEAASVSIADRWAAESQAKLPIMAVEIFRFRRLRNAVVHDLATEDGRRSDRIANDPPPTP